MNILKNPHFIFDVHVHEVVDASLSVIAQTFMDACTRTEHKLSRVSELVCSEGTVAHGQGQLSRKGGGSSLDSVGRDGLEKRRLRWDEWGLYLKLVSCGFVFWAKVWGRGRWKVTTASGLL